MMSDISQHEFRLQAVESLLLENGVQTVLDLGCGPGDLLARLIVHPQFLQLVGVDISAQALSRARDQLALSVGADETRLKLMHSCLTELDASLRNFDAATLVETIEHIDPHKLSAIEKAVFAELEPEMVIITTPNKDYNPLHGLAEGEFRHHDHRFEWSRKKFRSWSEGVAQRNHYSVDFSEIGPADFHLGSSSQLAIFKK